MRVVCWPAADPCCSSTCLARSEVPQLDQAGSSGAVLKHAVDLVSGLVEQVHLGRLQGRSSGGTNEPSGASNGGIFRLVHVFAIYLRELRGDIPCIA